MTQELTTISPLFSTPYITNDEYKQAPTSVDVDDFVGGGTMALNDVELSNVIARASSWVDSHCGQVLAATQDTESLRTRVSRDGMMHIHPRFWPVISVVSASFGYAPNQMQTLDPTTAWIEPMSVTFPLANYSLRFSGQIQFTANYAQTAQQYVTLTYVNGYANTVTTGTTVAGATSLPVKDITGFQPGQRFTIYDGVNTEIVQVASSFTVGTGAGNVTLAAGMGYAHATAGVSASALPPAVKQATIYITNVILKSRGNSAVVMDTLSPSTIIGNNPNVSNDYTMAVDLLAPFRRIR